MLIILKFCGFDFFVKFHFSSCLNPSKILILSLHMLYTYIIPHLKERIVNKHLSEIRFPFFFAYDILLVSSISTLHVGLKKNLQDQKRYITIRIQKIDWDHHIDYVSFYCLQLTWNSSINKKNSILLGNIRRSGTGIHRSYSGS